MNQASVDNGDAHSIFSSDYEKDVFADERKAHLQVEHDLVLGQLHVRFTFDQQGRIEEKSVDYLAMQRTDLEEMAAVEGGS